MMTFTRTCSFHPPTLKQTAPFGHFETSKLTMTYQYNRGKKTEEDIVNRNIFEENPLKKIPFSDRPF